MSLALPQSSFDSSIGAVLIGTLFDVYLMGVVATQVFHYYRSFPTDRQILRYSIGFLSFLSLFHSAAAMHMAYNWTITNYGNPAIIQKAQLAFTLDVPIDGIAAFFCQCFFAERVYLVSGKKKLLPIIILALTSIQLGFSIGAIIMEYKLDLLFDRFQEWEYGVIVWSLSAVLADILITTSLIYHLRRNRSDYAATNSIVDRLLKLTVQTNALTMLLAIACVFSFAVVPDLFGVIFQFSLAKSYVISLLASLNSRATLRTSLESANAKISDSLGSSGKKSRGIFSSGGAGPKGGAQRIYLPRGTMGGEELSPPASPAEVIRVNITETIHVDVDSSDDLSKELYQSPPLKKFGRIRAPPVVEGGGMKESIDHVSADQRARQNW